MAAFLLSYSRLDQCELRLQQSIPVRPVAGRATLKPDQLAFYERELRHHHCIPLHVAAIDDGIGSAAPLILLTRCATAQLVVTVHGVTLVVRGSAAAVTAEIPIA